MRYKRWLDDVVPLHFNVNGHDSIHVQPDPHREREKVSWPRMSRLEYLAYVRISSAVRLLSLEPARPRERRPSKLGSSNSLFSSSM